MIDMLIAVTNARTAGGQFIVGMQALPGNPCDGHTLTGQIARVERLTRERAYVDRGYRGHKHRGKAEVYIAHSRGISSPTIKRVLRRRNAIEPIIGHTKSDGLLERNTSPARPAMRSTLSSSQPGIIWSSALEAFMVAGMKRPRSR